MARSPNTPKPAPRARSLWRSLFSWALTDDELLRIKAGEKVKRKRTAPEGYAFNKRGDLISLRREAMRQGTK